MTLLASACSSRTASAGTAPSPPAGTTTTPAAGSSSGGGMQSPTVDMNDANQFVPVSLTVPLGTTVTWRNVGQVTHTVTADTTKAIRPADVSLPSGAQPWDSGDVAAGQSFSHTFDVPGTYRYVCIPHEVI